MNDIYKKAWYRVISCLENQPNDCSNEIKILMASVLEDVKEEEEQENYISDDDIPF